MTEHFEVPPTLQRIVWLNGLHLKQMMAFDTLTKNLGWNYNHRKPQVIWQSGSIVLDPVKVRRVRGHASHKHPQTPPAPIATQLQMGTYLTFYLDRFSNIEHCSLVLDGLEMVHKAAAASGQQDERNKIWLTKVNIDQVHHNSTEESMKTNLSSTSVSPSKLPRGSTKQPKSRASKTKSKKRKPPRPAAGERLSDETSFTNYNGCFLNKISSIANKIDNNTTSNLLNNTRSETKKTSAINNTILKYNQSDTDNDCVTTSINQTDMYNCYNSRTEIGKEWSNENDTTYNSDSGAPPPGVSDRINNNSHQLRNIEIDLSCPDEVTAMLSGDSDEEDEEWEDDCDDDIPKVVKKSVSTDITALLTREQQKHVIISPNHSINSDTTILQNVIDNTFTQNDTDLVQDEINNKEKYIDIDEQVSEYQLNYSDRINSDVNRSRNDYNTNKNEHSLENSVDAEEPVNCVNRIKEFEKKIFQNKLDKNIRNNVKNSTNGINKISLHTIQQQQNPNTEQSKRIYANKSQILNQRNNSPANKIEEIKNETQDDNRIIEVNSNKTVNGSNLKDSSENAMQSENDSCKLMKSREKENRCRDECNRATDNQHETDVGNNDISPSTASQTSQQLFHMPDMLQLSLARSSGGQMLVLLLRPKAPQQAWQFQTAYLTVRYSSNGSIKKNGCNREQDNKYCIQRKPQRRTRVTPRTGLSTQNSPVMSSAAR